MMGFPCGWLALMTVDLLGWFNVLISCLLSPHSAGIGRTGTIIVIDILVDTIHRQGKWGSFSSP